MLHLILSPGVRANDLRSQCKAAGEELKLGRLQERRRLQGDRKRVALLLHLGQEGRHLRQGLKAQLVKTQELESNPEKNLAKTQDCSLPRLSAAAALLQRLWLLGPPDRTSVHQGASARREKRSPSRHRQTGTPGSGWAKCCCRRGAWRWSGLCTGAGDPRRLS